MTAKQKANRERFKKVVAEAKKLRKKNPKLTQAQAVKQAWAIQISKEKKNPVNRVKKYIQEAKEGIRRGYYGSDYKKKGKKVGAVMKKAAPKKSSSYHKDTKSHNVNIRVMSGMGSAIDDLNYLLREKKKAVENFEVAKANRNRKGDTKEVKDHYNYWYNRLKDHIKGLDKRIAIAKKHIK